MAKVDLLTGEHSIAARSRFNLDFWWPEEYPPNENIYYNLSIEIKEDPAHPSTLPLLASQATVFRHADYGSRYLWSFYNNNDFDVTFYVHTIKVEP